VLENEVHRVRMLGKCEVKGICITGEIEHFQDQELE
jgi:hypothetical protein